MQKKHIWREFLEIMQEIMHEKTVVKTWTL